MMCLQFCIVSTLFQHVVPFFSLCQCVLSPGEPCGSAPWGLGNTGAPGSTGGAVDHLESEWRHEMKTWNDMKSTTWLTGLLLQLLGLFVFNTLICTTAVLGSSSNVQQLCWFSPWKVLSMSSFRTHFRNIITVIPWKHHETEYFRFTFLALAPSRSEFRARRGCRLSCSESASRHGVRRARLEKKRRPEAKEPRKKR